MQTDFDTRVSCQSQCVVGQLPYLMYLNFSIPVILDIVKKLTMHQKIDLEAKNILYDACLSASDKTKSS